LRRIHKKKKAMNLQFTQKILMMKVLFLKNHLIF
jgi:hypothetical protein